MRNNLFPVAKEGWKTLFFSFSAFLLFILIDWNFLAFLSLLLTLSFLFIFRNPERELPAFEINSFVSPVDGVVKSIEEIKGDAYAYKVEIEGSYLDVALLRMPTAAKLLKLQSFNGTRVSKNSKLYSDLNENTSLTFEESSSNKYRVDLKVKNSFISLHVDLIEGQKVNQASRFGLMLQGVTTIYLPSNFRLNTQVGTRLKASESLIGYFS